jgi:hypothetical protein
MYRNNFSFFACAIITKSDYSSFTVDVLYPIMQQWPWWPIAATDMEEKGTVVPSLPPSKLQLDNSLTPSYTTKTLSSISTF